MDFTFSSSQLPRPESTWTAANKSNSQNSSSRFKLWSMKSVSFPPKFRCYANCLEDKTATKCVKRDSGTRTYSYQLSITWTMTQERLWVPTSRTSTNTSMTTWFSKGSKKPPQMQSRYQHQKTIICRSFSHRWRFYPIKLKPRIWSEWSCAGTIHLSPKRRSSSIKCNADSETITLWASWENGTALTSCTGRSKTNKTQQSNLHWLKGRKNCWKVCSQLKCSNKATLAKWTSWEPKSLWSKASLM